MTIPRNSEGKRGNGYVQEVGFEKSSPSYYNRMNSVQFQAQGEFRIFFILLI